MYVKVLENTETEIYNKKYQLQSRILIVKTKLTTVYYSYLLNIQKQNMCLKVRYFKLTILSNYMLYLLYRVL